MRRRGEMAHGNSGVPIVGDPDHIARQLIELSRAGLTGIAVSLVNYADELPSSAPRCCRGWSAPGCGCRRDGPYYSSFMPASLTTLPTSRRPP